MKRIIIATALAGFLTLAGCSSSPASEKPTESSSEKPVEAPADQQQAAGSEANPYPLGTPGIAGDWEITINSWNPNVNAEVQAAGDDMSMLNEGMQYALMNLTIKWVGEGAGDIANVNLQHIPNGPGMVTQSWAAYGTTPTENKLAYAELTTGGTVTGDMLYEVPTGDTGDGVFQFSAFDTEEMPYFAAK